MIIIKQGNLFPDVEEIVTDENDVPVNVTGFTITFSLRKARDPSVIVIQHVAGVVTDGPNGGIAYRWQTADQSLGAGTYEYLFYIVPTAGDPFYAPTSGWGVVVIEESF